MLIKRVKLENFKKFKSLEREFGPGINVVKGRLNETGKSTLLEGILTALFKDSKRSAPKLGSLNTWGTDRRPRLHIEFQVDGEDYALVKDFNKKTLCLTALSSQEQWDVPRKVEEKLHSLLGAISEDLFQATCCIRQDEVRDVQSGQKEVSHSMERIITGGSRGTTATDAIKELEKEIDGMRKGLERYAKSPGPIAALKKEVAELEQKLAESSDKVKELEKLRKELPEVETRLAQVKEELKRYRKLLENNKKRQEIEEKIERLKRDYNTIDGLTSKLNSLESERQELNSKLRSLSGFDDQEKVADAEKDLKTLKGRRQDIEQDLSERKQELAAVEAQLKQRAVLASLASRTTLLAGIVITILGFALMVWHGLAAIAGGLGIVLVIVSLLAKNSVIANKKEREHLQQRIADMMKALEEIKQEEDRILSAMNCVSAEEFDHKCKEFKDLTDRLKITEARRTALLEGQTIEGLEQQKRDLIRDIAIEEAKLTEDLKSTRLSPEEFIKLQERTQKLEGEEKRLERRMGEIEGQLKQAGYDPEVLSQLEEKLQESQEKLAAEERKLKVYELARDFIARAREETLRDVHAELQQKIEEYLSIFTNGKYNKIQLKPGTLECLIFSEEKADWVKPEELSGGTMDQFYLAFRLALARLIYRDQLPPLVFDDPFYNFDPIRLSRTLDSLKKLSRSHQVIIFTLGDTYDKIADRIIELPQE